jgi:hypothetical protein
MYFIISFLLSIILPSITTAVDISTTIQNHLKQHHNSPILITQEISSPDVYLHIFSMGFGMYISTYNIALNLGFRNYPYTINPFHIHQISSSTGTLPALYSITVTGDSKTICANFDLLIVNTNQLQSAVDQFGDMPLSCTFTFEFHADTSTFKIAAVFLDNTGNNVSELRYLRPIFFDAWWKLGITTSPQTSPPDGNHICDDLQVCESFKLYQQAVAA